MSQLCVRSNQNPPGIISGDGGGNTPLRNKTKAQEAQPSANRHGGARRQENVRWASELSFSEGSRHWQEQVGQLQRQLDFSTSMCQTLLQDQQVSSGHSWKRGTSTKKKVKVCRLFSQNLQSVCVRRVQDWTKLGFKCVHRSAVGVKNQFCVLL